MLTKPWPDAAAAMWTKPPWLDDAFWNPAFVISILALAIAWRGLTHAKNSAKAAAASAAAAEVSAAAATVSAKAAAESNARAQRAEDRDRVDWAFDQIDPDRYELRNKGTDAAHGVRIEHGELVVEGAPLSFTEYPAGHAERYTITWEWRDFTDDRLVITWHHQPDCQDPQQRKELLVV